MSIKSELNIICQNCDGNGKNTFITAAGHYVETCVYCCGTGKEDQVQRAIIARGQRLRERRVNAGLPRSIVANALGVTSVGLSNIESGRTTNGIKKYEEYLSKMEDAQS